jgi:hypothetical protein
VIDHQHDHRADDGDEHAPQIIMQFLANLSQPFQSHQL